MAFAFGRFDEPYAWLIRGLVEYGWADVSSSGGRIPLGRFGGMDLVRFRDSTGRDGVHLLMTAAAGNQVVAEDGVYDFSLRCTHRDGRWTIVVRSVEANYLQEFPFDPANPSWAAGYVHQALTTYVPQFAQWRLGGGELSWAQRKGLPEIAGEPCSSDLARFIDEIVRMRRPMETGPVEGWWMNELSAPPPAGHAAAGKGPAAATPAAGGKAAGAAPLGPIAVAGRMSAGGVSTTELAMKKAGPAGKALVGASSLLCLVGVVSLVNALLTVVLFFLERPTALTGSACFGISFLIFGLLGVFGGQRLSRLSPSLLPWAGIAGNLALPPLLGISMLFIDPVCCAMVGPLFVNVPIALWALATMVDANVVKARADLAGR